MRDKLTAEIEVRTVAADGAETLRLLEAYFEELKVRFGAFEPPSVELLRADAQGGAVLIAYVGEIAVACGALRRLGGEKEQTAEIKRMFVTPEARGKGVGRLLLRAIEEKARALGFEQIVLDTAAVLTEAAAMYLREGYEETERYNDNPYAARWFRKRLMG